MNLSCLSKGVIFLICLSCQVQSSKSRIEVISFESSVFDNKRNLRIYLPEGYDSGATFQVLFLNDGQHVFTHDSLPGENSWHVNEIADSLIKHDLIHPIIVVGIDHLGHVERANELLPWEDIYLYPPNPNPQGASYPQFLIDELIPFIRSNYRIKTDRMSMGLGGFSYGGLITAYTGIVTERFGKLLVESPSLYVDEQHVLEMLNSKNTMREAMWYVGVGTNELNIDNCDESNEDNLMAVDDVVKLLQLIEGKSAGSETHFERTKCGIHSYETAAKRLPEALTFLYGKNQ